MSNDNGTFRGIKKHLSPTRKGWISLVAFMWPFVYFYNYFIPTNGTCTVIGQDFYGLFYTYKLHLLANLAHGHFPLWSPAEAAGYPFYSSPFSQTFYPFNAVLVGWYKVLGGYSEYDHQIFTVLGVSIFCLGLFKWLSGLGIPARAALVAALIMGVSFKFSEILRLPNAVHTAAWYPWILLGITQAMRDVSWKPRIGQASLLVFYVLCLCTAGYPYFVFYSVFLFVPYFFIHFVPALRRGLLGMETADIRAGVVTLAAVLAVAAAPVGLYLRKMTNLMAQTVDRGGHSLEYSTSHNFDFEDTVGSLVYPPFSQFEGWYFFGITGLLIILFYAVHLFSRSSRETGVASSRWGAGLLLSWIAIVSCISYGRESFLFMFLWKHFPGFAALRVWGRFNIVLVPLIALLLSKAYSSFEACLETPHRRGDRRVLKAIVLMAIYLAVLAIQLHLHTNGMHDAYWVKFAKHLAGWEVHFIYTGVAAISAILLALFLGRVRWNRRPLYLWGCSALLVLTSAAEMHPVGARTWTRPDRPIPSTRPNLKADTMCRASLEKRRVFTGAWLSTKPTPVFNTGIFPNWYFDRYAQFLKKAKKEAASRNILLGVRGGKRVFLSSRISFDRIDQFLHDSKRFDGTAKIRDYRAEELVVDVVMSTAGYVSFIDNWDPDWRARVDGDRAKLELLFGTFKSVRCPAGKHVVGFQYEPGLL